MPYFISFIFPCLKRDLYGKLLQCYKVNCMPSDKRHAENVNIFKTSVRMNCP